MWRLTKQELLGTDLSASQERLQAQQHTSAVQVMKEYKLDSTSTCTSQEIE